MKGTSKLVDLWKTGGGLPERYLLEVEEAWFGTDPEYNPEALLFKLRGTGYVVDEETGDVDVLEDWTESYSVGAGWQAMDGGETARHPGGERQRFNPNSKMGRLINSIVASEDVAEVMQERGQPNLASTWQGLVLDMEREYYKYKIRDGSEGETNVALVVGLGEVPGKKKAKKKAAPAKKKASSKKKGSDLRKAVLKFAADFDDHDDFVAAVFDEDEFDRADELEANEELQAEVLDPDGLWAEA